MKIRVTTNSILFLEGYIQIVVESKSDEKTKGVIEMRGIYCAIKSAMLGGIVLVLSASPALASGENKVMNDKPKVEINKVEKNKDEKVMLHEKKVEDIRGVLRIDRLGIHRLNLLDEDLLGEELLEDLLGEED